MACVAVGIRVVHNSSQIPNYGSNLKICFAREVGEDQLHLSGKKLKSNIALTKYNGKVLDAGTGNKIKIMQAKDQKVKMKLVLSWKEFAELRLT